MFTYTIDDLIGLVFLSVIIVLGLVLAAAVIIDKIKAFGGRLWHRIKK